MLSPFLGFEISQHTPQSELDDVGVGFYGQATATFDDRVDVAVGARVDHENKKASLNTFFSPAIAPGRLVTPEESFSNVSPQGSVAVRLQPGRMVYVTAGRGFKAGGFNAGVTGWQRRVRRRAHLESRGRREDGLGGRRCDGQRRRISNRLGRSAVEPA